jgi:integrase
MGRSFYLRTYKSGMIYAEILDPATGAHITTRSTGTRSREEVAFVVGQWLRDGISSSRKKKPHTVEVVTGLKNILLAIEKTADLDAEGAMQIAAALRKRQLIDFPTVKAGKGSIDFIKFLIEFWDYEKSPYIGEKLVRGYRMGRHHCHEMGNRIKANWEPYFKGRVLDSITREELKQFSLQLSGCRKVSETAGAGQDGEKLSAAYINQILLAGFTALKWAKWEGMIALDPTEGLLKFSGKGKKRGVLTPQEAAAVFEAKWKDKRSYIGNLLSLTTGLRAGEVLALRKFDIPLTGNTLFVTHSWSVHDGLKCPKNGEERKVPLLPEVREKLMELVKENPHETVADPFVFYGVLADKPMDIQFLIDGLRGACREVGNNPAGWTVNPAATEGADTGVATLWMIQGEKNVKGELQGTWSDPVQVQDMIRPEVYLTAKSKDNHIEVRYRSDNIKPETPMIIDTQTRTIVFHSWRHYYVARMMDKMTAEQVTRITGHKSEAVFAEYADHIITENLEQMGKTGAEVFGNIIQFSKKKGA